MGLNSWNFLQTIKSQIQSELLDLVTKTTKHILAIRTNLVNTELTQVQHPLLELLDLVYTQFKLIAGAHGLLLKHYLSAAQRHTISDVKPYDIADFWTQAQAVVSTILGPYLRKHFDVTLVSLSFILSILCLVIRPYSEIVLLQINFYKNVKQKPKFRFKAGITAIIVHGYCYRVVLLIHHRFLI